MKLSKIALTALLLGSTAAANAASIDFRAMGDLNERGYAVLSTAHMDITGYVSPSGDPAYAYLDGGWGGLGVCKNLGTDSLGNDNQCAPASDDNVTGDMSYAEVLNFTATQNITITKIWFNNNHDVDRSLLGDTINIAGSNYTFSAADQTNVSGTRSDWTWSGLIGLNIGDSFDIGYVNEQFYVTKIQYNVPEPAILGMLALGLIGFGISAKRKKA